MVVNEPGALSELRAFVRQVAGEQQHVARLDLPREPHEAEGVEGQSCK